MWAWLREPVGFLRPKPADNPTSVRLRDELRHRLEIVNERMQRLRESLGDQDETRA